MRDAIETVSGEGRCHGRSAVAVTCPEDDLAGQQQFGGSHFGLACGGALDEVAVSGSGNQVASSSTSRPSVPMFVIVDSTRITPDSTTVKVRVTRMPTALRL